MKKLGLVLVAGFTLMFGVSKMESISEPSLKANEKLYEVRDISQNLKYVIGDSVNPVNKKDIGIAFDITEKNEYIFGDMKDGDEFIVVRGENNNIVDVKKVD